MTGSKMKALVVRAPMQFAIEEVSLPSLPDGGLLLQVEACGLCGSDLRTLRSGHRKVTFPWIIGHEICGRVAVLGSKYHGPWNTGDRLAVGPLAYCGRCDFCLDGRFELCENYREIGQAWPGGMAETIALPEECLQLGNIRPVPLTGDPAELSISEPVSSCIHAQEKGDVSLGDTILIFGAGPVGCLHASLARLRGAAKVILADINRERLMQAQAFQPDALIDSSQADLPAEVARLTGGKGADVVITATPAPDAQVQAVEVARKGGRIILFGGLPVDQARPGINMNTVHYRALHILGTTIFAPRHQRQALDLILSGRLAVDRMITRFPLSDFDQAARLALAGKILKAVLMP